MKRIVFLALVFLSIQASAQLDKNTMMAGGSVVFNKYTPKGGNFKGQPASILLDQEIPISILNDINEPIVT